VIDMKVTTNRQFSIASLMLAGSSVVYAAEPLPEEVQVIGQRQIFRMEEQLIEAEDAVYALYNELNTDDLYDVTCVWEKPLGTNMRHRVCRPGFISVAEQSRGQEFMSGITGMGFTTGKTVELENERHNPILKRKLQEAVQSSPELAARMMEHQELKAALEERKSGLFGRK
jgi:hypothetical protein